MKGESLPWMCIAEQEAVSLLVHFSHLLVYAAQEAQLVEVLDGEVGALVHSFQHMAMLFREPEDRIESIHHMLIEWRIVLDFRLLDPVFWTCQAFC